MEYRHWTTENQHRKTDIGQWEIYIGQWQHALDNGKKGWMMKPTFDNGKPKLDNGKP